MPTLLELLRTGKVKGPQQQEFNLETWRSNFAKLDHPGPADGSLYAAGLWFDQEFSNIRKLTSKAVLQLNVQDPTRMFIGIATREWIVLRGKVTEFIQNYTSDSFFPEELAEPIITNLLGAQITPQGAIETLVDAIRFPLSAKFPPPSEEAEDSPQVAITASEVLFKSAQLYHVLEQLWLRLVWNDFRFVKKNGTVLIYPSDHGLHQAEAVSTFRRQVCHNEALHLAQRMWMHELPSRIKEKALRSRKLLTILKKPSGKVRIKISEALRYPDNQHSAPINHIFLTHEYVHDYVRRPISQWHNLKLEQIMMAYDLLSQMPGQMLMALPPDTGISTPEEAMRYTPEFDKADLRNAFISALNISLKQANFVLDYMTHHQRVREQLWFKPILELPGGKISILLPAVDGINFCRLFDRLLKDIPDAEGEVGEIFEKYVRGKLCRSVNRFKFKPGLCMYTESLKLSPAEKESEQIDLVFSLGDRIFIGECKASLYPAEPLEEYHFLERLKTEAVAQAVRKSEFVRTHMPAFLSKTRFPVDSRRAEVLPIVVTNDNLYSGFVISGVPICDVLLLTKYFDKGFLELFVEQDASGNLTPAQIHPF